MGCLDCNNSKTFHVKIVLLDKQEIVREIQRSTRGQELLEFVFRRLNLVETHYFGLRFRDNNNQTHWLCARGRVCAQTRGLSVVSLYLGVKFYAGDPSRLREEVTRYQFFLQLRSDVVQGRLPVGHDVALDLAAFALQSELGDYDPLQHLPGYASEFSFVSSSALAENEVEMRHKKLRGLRPAEAELAYLERVKWLDLYGVDLHPVMGEDQVEYFLGLAPSGIMVIRNRAKVGNYFWPRVCKIYQRKRFLMLRVKDKSNEESTVGFETPTKEACKHLFTCAVDHHAFFMTSQSSLPGQNWSKTLPSEDQSEAKNTPTSKFVRRLSQRFGRAPKAKSTPKSLDTSTRSLDRRLSSASKLSSSSQLSLSRPVEDASRELSLRSLQWIEASREGQIITSRSRRRGRSGMASDNESEASLGSVWHKEKTAESGSESEKSTLRRRRRRSRHGSYKWVAGADGDASVGRRSGYANSGVDTDTEMRDGNGPRRNRRRHRSRSRSPGSEARSRLPPEMLSHLNFKLVEPGPKEIRGDIPYTSILANSSVRDGRNGEQQARRPRSMVNVANVARTGSKQHLQEGRGHRGNNLMMSNKKDLSEDKLELPPPPPLPMDAARMASLNSSGLPVATSTPKPAFLSLTPQPHSIESRLGHSSVSFHPMLPESSLGPTPPRPPNPPAAMLGAMRYEMSTQL